MLPALIAALALSAPPAHAETSPAARGVAVGAIALGGGAVGVIAGGGTGLALGAATCSGSFECWAPLIGMALGGTSGAVIGPPVAAGIAAHGYGVHGGKVALWTLGGAGIGASLMLLGGIAESDELVTFGAVTGAVAMPVAAGIAAGTQRPRETEGLPLVQVVPGITRGGGSVRLVVSGF